MGGTSVPMLFGRIAALWDKSIGTEVAPTSASFATAVSAAAWPAAETA
ncbi:DUF6053 domain-containing protein [Lysobacter enzymogenes]